MASSLISETITNKLNIYLIKQGYSTYESIIIDDTTLHKVVLRGIGNFYYTKTEPQPPSWIHDFFLDDVKILKKDFWVAGTNAILICKVNIGKTTRFFAIPFGSGRFLLNEHCTEERFGLITTVNLAEADKIRSIDKRVVASNPKLAREQLTKVGSANDFGIDIEKDLLHGITAESSDPQFGKTISGKDAFTFSAKVDTRNILDILKRCYHYYKRRTYKETFPWIDLLKEIKEPAKIDELNSKLIELVNNNPTEVALAVPDIIDWSEIKGFKYSQKKKDTLYNDLSLIDFLNEKELTSTFSCEDLYSNHVSCWNGDDEKLKMKWDIFHCISAEVKVGKRLFILSNGKWYDIASNFVDEVQREVNGIASFEIEFPKYAHLDENEYNRALATKLHGCCLDGDDIIYGGGRSRIEFCDVLAPAKKIIHAKRYGGSAVLSHLFNQGYVSSELLALDSGFRKSVRAKLPNGPFKNMIPLDKPKTEKYKIIFIIIGDKGKNSVTDLPFFSKITLRRCVRQLKGFNFNVYVNFVPIELLTI